MNKRIIKILALLLIGLIIYPTCIFADSGAKPSITIKIKNLNTTNYLIDLLIFDEDGKNYYSPLNYNGNGEQYSSTYNSLKNITIEQLQKLHDINDNGWISESTRWNKYFLFSDCVGNSNFTHEFSYFGTPEIYKVVIINNDTNEMKISNVIVRKDFSSYVTIDYNTMKDKQSSNLLKTIFKIFVCLNITLCIELLLAYIFKVRNYNIVTYANVITNIVLQILLAFASNYFLTFIIGEVVVIIAELVIYLLKFKNVSKIRTFIYSVIANIITAIIPFIMIRI